MGPADREEAGMGGVGADGGDCGRSWAAGKKSSWSGEELGSGSQSWRGTGSSMVARDKNQAR